MVTQVDQRRKQNTSNGLRASMDAVSSDQAVVSAVSLGVWPESCRPSGTSGRHPDPPLGYLAQNRQLDTCWRTPTSDVT